MGEQMGNFIKTQNSFANGQIDSDFFARDDIHGLSRLENMDVISGGGLTRRRGLDTVATLTGDARLIPFSVSEDENYMLVVTANHILVYSGTTRVRDMLTPWPASVMARLQYAQRFGTMIFVHPDYQPRILQKNGDTFTLSLFEFERNDADMSINIPFMKFDDATGIKITVTTNSASNSHATLTTNKNYWTADHVGQILLMQGKQWNITQYISATQVVAFVNGGYELPKSPISDWREAAFGAYRGWPCSITFHQDRLVFGGSRAWPSGVWMSKVGRHHNFDVGTGLDDESIFITLLSQQRQQICTVVSSDNLQILTSVGEWAISNKPLTPASVNIKQHTAVGSVWSRYLPPQKIDGETVFISGTKRDIRQLTLDELGENYSATDLCAMSKQLMTEPVDIAYNPDTRQLFVVLENGNMAVLNKNNTLGISAWGIYKTQGQFKSVAVLDGCTYVVVRRGTTYCLEKFSDTALVDGGQYAFSFTAASLPMRAGGHNPRKIKLRKISARVMDTKTLFINGTRAVLPNAVYAVGAPGYNGDVSIGVLGTCRDTIAPTWEISSDESLPATVLSVTLDGWYTV